MKLSVVILTRNESNHIAECIQSVCFADEILVIDSESTDDTIVKAQSQGARVLVNSWPGFARQRQFGIDNAKGQWILFLDADERVTEALQKRIQIIINDSSHPVHGYEIPRRNFVCGKEMRHMWPARSLRFFQRDKSSMTLEREVHEKVVINGVVARLKEPMLHYTYDSMEQYLTKMNAYTSLLARQAYDTEKTTSLPRLYWKAFVRYHHYFIDQYISRGAFRDGLFGFYLSVLHAVSGMTMYFKIADLKRKNNEKNSKNT